MEYESGSVRFWTLITFHYSDVGVGCCVVVTESIP